MEAVTRFSPVLYVENAIPEQYASLIRYVDSLDYQMYWHKPTFFNPQNFFGNPQNVFANGFSANMLCVARELKQEVLGLEPVEVPAA